MKSSVNTQKAIHGGLQEKGPIVNSAGVNGAAFAPRQGIPQSDTSQSGSGMLRPGVSSQESLQEKSSPEKNRSGAMPSDPITLNTMGKRNPRHLGLCVERYFTESGVHPFESINWQYRTAKISGQDGSVVFEQSDIEVPDFWSQMATNVVVQKYFRGAVGTRERETSIRQLISRVADTISAWGEKQNYFASEADAETFRHELSYLLVTQRAAFNSPVWFNVGVEDHPQCSACFINSVKDSMTSIMDLVKTEGMLFKFGSGTGTNFSTLRGSKELLSGGGEASGPVSFMRGYDSFAGVIKSGGKTRRAAKMVILNADHPDIEDFVWSKANEEKKAWHLIDAGYDGSFNGEAYNSVFFQNANHSVRCSDEFMRAVDKDGLWNLNAVSNGEPVKTLKATDLMDNIVDAAHQCGDPGMQWDTTINDWHTCPNTAPINASNPCSEYMFLDDTACNLASINLRKFQEKDGTLNIESFRRAVRILILAQEIIVDNAKYPTPKIGANSHAFRPLGLGYANLGAFLMSRGVPYDSDPGRAIAASITALMHGEANRVSSLIAADRGAFEGYKTNRAPMLKVMMKHRKALTSIDKTIVSRHMNETLEKVWDEVIDLGEKYGFRNAQVTVIAPTGTIAFMMDCDTTGIEPDIALVKYKKLVGGGMLKIVNNSVDEALTHLGYAESDRKSILKHIEDNDGIEGAIKLKKEDLEIFDCAFPAPGKDRSIHYMGHIKMMGATQPFLSGAISKTVNMPHDCTKDDISDAYMTAWKSGVKALAVYRDGCKRIQPLSTKKDDGAAARGDGASALPPVVENTPLSRVDIKGPPQAIRHKLPEERESLTHKFSVGGHEGYITIGMYKDGHPGEIFIRMAKEGSTISGLMDSIATAISLCLQHGVPLQLLVDKFSHTRFEPSGWSNNKEIGYAKSIMDYIFRWLDIKFPGGSYYATRAASDAQVEVTSMQTNTAEDTFEGKAKDVAEPSSSDSINISSGGTIEVEELSTQGLTTDGDIGGVTVAAEVSVSAADNASRTMFYVSNNNAPPCHDCGSIEMVPNGSCYKCLNCGATSGCS